MIHSIKRITENFKKNNFKIDSSLYEIILEITNTLLDNESQKNICSIGANEEMKSFFERKYPEFELIELDKNNITQNIEVDLLFLASGINNFETLKKLNESVSNIKIIHTGVSFKKQGKNDTLFHTMFEFLHFNGFKFIGNITENKDCGEAVFINSKYFNFEDLICLKNILNQEAPVTARTINRLIKSGDFSFYDYFQAPRYDISVDVIMPTISKDFRMLKFVIESIEKNIMHTINNIFIVSPRGEMEQFCKKNNYKFIDENTVLPIKKNEIKYAPNGKDRSGWIFQQLLKLNADKISNSKYVLIADADTVFANPTSFFVDGKVIFDCSDEYHPPYFETYKKLLGQNERFSSSFVAHHMLFEREELQALKEKIEANNDNNPWYSVIIALLNDSEMSSFSEYETYANNFYFSKKEKVCVRYWHNYISNYRTFKKLLKQKERIKQYKTISVHTYK